MNLKWKRAESKSRPSPNRIPNYCGAWSIGLPSVRQPPLPLQEFLALQPLSLVLQPPLPLQEFWPLQACLSFVCLLAFLVALSVDAPAPASCANRLALVPVTKPPEPHSRLPTSLTS